MFVSTRLSSSGRMDMRRFCIGGRWRSELLKAVGKLKEAEGYGISKCRYTGMMKGHSVVF